MPKQIGSYLTTIIPQEHQWKIRLFSHWNNIIGKLKTKVRIEKINNNSLTLGVCHPTWAHELFLLSPTIKQKINTILKENKIKTIQFKAVDFSERTYHSNKTNRYASISNYETQECCLSITESTNLEQIKNFELRSAITKFHIRCKKVQQIKGEKCSKKKPKHH